MIYVLSGLLVILLAILIKKSLTPIIVFEYERGIKFVNGKFMEILMPGRYWPDAGSLRIEKVDMRPRLATVSGQEILCADGVAVKISLAARYEVADPAFVVNNVQDYEAALHLELQIALREIIGAVEIDMVMKSRDDLSQKLMERAAPTVGKLGLTLHSVGVKDVMLSGKLRDLYAQTVQARLQGMAALEKARGETAALRNLANAAKMLEDNPNLLQLRMLQAIGESSGNTIVWGAPPTAFPAPSGQKAVGKET